MAETPFGVGLPLKFPKDPFFECATRIHFRLFSAQFPALIGQPTGDNRNGNFHVVLAACSDDSRGDSHDDNRDAPDDDR